MVKMHTRQKRAKCLTHGHQHGTITTKKVVGKRTFKTKEAALAYAKQNNLSSTVIPAKKGKRFQLA